MFPKARQTDGPNGLHFFVDTHGKPGVTVILKKMFSLQVENSFETYQFDMSRHVAWCIFSVQNVYKYYYPYYILTKMYIDWTLTQNIKDLLINSFM